MSILVDDMKQLKLEGVVPRLRNGGGGRPDRNGCITRGVDQSVT